MPPEGAVLEHPVVPAAQPSPSVTPNLSDWHTHLTDELKTDPIVSKWAEKASEKDIASLIKTHAHLSSRMGSAINLPGKDAKPEEVTALKAKLIEAGVLPAPITDPKTYGITRPESLPPGVEWSDALSDKFAGTLQKHQIPKDAVADLMALHLESLGQSAEAVKFDQEQSLLKLRAEHGEHYDARVEMVSRIMPGIFSQESLDYFDRTGAGNDPKFLSAMLRVAPAFTQDSSFMETIPKKGGEITGSAARDEYAKMMSDPTHPHYAGLKRGDPKAEAYANTIYRQAFGNEQKPIESMSAVEPS